MLATRFFTTAAMIALMVAVPAAAQDQLSSNSGSNSAANSGSVSGAESNGNQQGQTQSNNGGNNAGIGSSQNELSSASQSGAISGSESDSRSNSNQGQTQGQSANNDQGQSQGQDARNTQGQTATNANSVGQQATNQQGVTVATTFNSFDRKINRVYTNNAVPLAASSSFSSDYCGGTVSGGASAAPIGISFGGAAPTFDKSCQSLRRAEKFGMVAANYQNMGQPDMAMKAMSLMLWSVCTADSGGPKADKSTAAACAQVLQMGDATQAAGVYAVPTPPAPRAVTPLETQKPNVQPLPNDYVPQPERLKEPRGDAGKPVPMAVAH